MKKLLFKGRDYVRHGLANMGFLNPFRFVFRDVEFETTAYCNRKCVYCPNSKHERKGDEEGRYMRRETFEKLLDDLCVLGFKGTIAPHLYGEPMSDMRLESWIRRIREKLPGCKIKIVTNGDYLNPSSYRRLILAGVDRINISQHGPQLSAGAYKLLSALSGSERKKRLSCFNFYDDYRRKQSMLNTRGGEVELKKNSAPPVCCAYVIYPVINTFGDVILCCNDFHGKYVSGNIMKRTLKDIWWDPKNINLRKNIYKGKFDLVICRDCRI